MIPVPLQVALVLQQFEMFVNRTVGRVAEALADLPVGRRDTLRAREISDEIEDLFLPAGELCSHGPRVKRK